MKNKLLNLIANKRLWPLKISSLIKLMDTDRSNQQSLLDDFIKTGELIRYKDKLYLPDTNKFLTGLYMQAKAGYGFVNCSLSDKDIFIPEPYTGRARHKDKVACRILRLNKLKGNYEAEILYILERGIKKVVGNYQDNNGFGFVEPSDKRIPFHIYVSKSSSNYAKTGQKVVVKLFDRNKGKNPEGKVVDILGFYEDPYVDIQEIVHKYNINIRFSKRALREALELSAIVEDKDKKGRIDLRHWKTITIDSEDTKDVDDAISIKYLKNGNYSLAVHIADVSHYVKNGTAIDNEALKRGTSIYLIDKVIHMLPEKLSNNLCSLNPGEDRLALSCVMEIDETTAVVKHEILETVIKVDEKMTYNMVDRILQIKEDYNCMLDTLKHMAKLRLMLLNRRIKKGAIELPLRDTKVKLDDKGRVTDILKDERSLSSSIIEEFMLICNETVAEEFFWLQRPFIFRNHGEPDANKVNMLKLFMNNFGLRVNYAKILSKDIQNLLNRVKGTNEEYVISKIILSSFKKAEYSSKNEGHFGLSTAYYTHFTSPIRRYADLQIHRVIKAHMHNKEKLISKLRNKISDIAKLCSDTEIVAERLEREVINMKKIEYMEDKVGEEFYGIVSGITPVGIYVELDNAIEGLVLKTELTDDIYIFDEKNHLYIGTTTNRIYKLGMSVLIRVVKSDKQAQRLYFLIIQK